VSINAPPPLLIWVQVAPPSVVPPIQKLGPAATQLVVLGQLIPKRWFVVPELWATQLAPPSMLLRTEPTAPTTKQVVVGQLTPARNFPPLMTIEVHVVPPSEVRNAMPESPTASHVVVLAQLMALIAVEMPVV
jgi:hypothetical protein